MIVKIFETIQCQIILVGMLISWGRGGWELNRLFDEFKMRNKLFFLFLNCSLIIY